MTLTVEDTIKRVDGNNIVDKAGIDSNANMKASESTTVFFILEVRLVFAKLRQGFSTALILYYFDQKYYISMKTNVSGYAIGRLFN